MTSTSSKPVVISTRRPLPLSQLAPDDFERLTYWLVRREGFDGVEHLGAAGSEQGRDVIATRDGLRYAFQCKRVQSFTAADARAEITRVRGLPED
ncbi:MAG: restriction endonuclease [Acidobacteriota bacterium]